MTRAADAKVAPASLWPLPALLTWAAAWLAFHAIQALGLPALLAVACATALGVAAAVFGGTTAWRRIFIGGGISAVAARIRHRQRGHGARLARAQRCSLLLLYPLRSWRDAPLFPTPSGALDGLSQHIALAPGCAHARCGLRPGRRPDRACAAAFPTARLEGLDWSWPLVIACRLRCRDAAVRRADIWQADWSSQDLVYLFQRPESMARAVAKARRELRAGAWLVSLEFPAPGLRPDAQLEAVAGKPVWAYRAPFTSAGPTTHRSERRLARCALRHAARCGR